MPIRLVLTVVMVVLTGCALRPAAPPETRSSSCGVDPRLVTELIGDGDVRWSGQVVDVRGDLPAGDISCGIRERGATIVSVVASAFTAEFPRDVVLSEEVSKREFQRMLCEEYVERDEPYSGTGCADEARASWIAVFDDRMVTVSLTTPAERQDLDMARRMAEDVDDSLSDR